MSWTFTNHVAGIPTSPALFHLMYCTWPGKAAAEHPACAYACKHIPCLPKSFECSLLLSMSAVIEAAQFNLILEPLVQLEKHDGG